MTSTADRIATLLEKTFKIDRAQLTPHARLEDLGVDSIGIAELIFDIEDALGLKLQDAPASLSTFGDVVRYIYRAVAAKEAATAVTASGVASIRRVT